MEGKKTSNIEITSSSTKEEISAFFSTRFKTPKDLQDNLIKEDISGDILFDIQEDELKKLGFKIGPIKKIKKYLSDNKKNFPEIKIDDETIDSTSTPEMVRNFFDNRLGYKGDLAIDGKQLLEMNKEDIAKMGLNLGQRKKLEKYIKNFKLVQSKKQDIKIKEDENKDILEQDKDLNEEDKNKLKDKDDSKEKNENEKLLINPDNKNEEKELKID